MVPNDTSSEEGSPLSSQFQIIVQEKLVGMRLDQFLSLELPEVSRSTISASIRKKTISVNGTAKKSSYRLKNGETVTGKIETEPEVLLTPEKIDFKVIYEDEWLLLLSKPPGLVVHPGSGNPSGTLVNGLLYYYNEIKNVGDTLNRPGIVHRLDKDTSGMMVVAKRDEAHKRLVEMFKNHELKKEYYTLVCGVPKHLNGRIVTSIGRHPIQRQKMAVREIGGKHAATNWEMVRTFNNQYSLLKIHIETGRTHQIRVHMAHLGFPVAGDVLYGRSKAIDKFPRQMLHAWRLAFNHPMTGRPMSVKAELWPDFEATMSAIDGEEFDLL